MAESRDKMVDTVPQSTGDYGTTQFRAGLQRGPNIMLLGPALQLNRCLSDYDLPSII